MVGLVNIRCKYIGYVSLFAGGTTYAVWDAKDDEYVDEYMDEDEEAIA